MKYVGYCFVTYFGSKVRKNFLIWFCDIFFGNSFEKKQHILEDWFGEKKGFVWFVAYFLKMIFLKVLLFPCSILSQGHNSSSSSFFRSFDPISPPLLCPTIELIDKVRVQRILITTYCTVYTVHCTVYRFFH